MLRSFVIYKVAKNNTIRDACTPQPGKRVFDIMRYTRNETVHRSGDFHNKCQLCKGPNNIRREKHLRERRSVNYEAVNFINLSTATIRNRTIN